MYATASDLETEGLYMGVGNFSAGPTSERNSSHMSC